jgi:hypothetical protein
MKGRVFCRSARLRTLSVSFAIGPLLLCFLWFRFSSYRENHVRFWLLTFVDSPSHCPIYLSILSMVKNEGPYLPEWIEYHLLVGIQRFWILNNNSTDNTSEVLLRYVAFGIVNLTFRPGINQQLPVYNSLVPALRDLCYWVALIDADEFIVPLETHSVPGILRKFEGSPGVTINWVMYGSNGKEKMEDGLVIERFQRHVSWDDKINRYPKSIVNPRMFGPAQVHDQLYVHELKARDPLGRWNTQDFHDREPVYEVMRLNHYWTKSYEEFYQKRSRGLSTDMTPKLMELIMATVREQLNSLQDVVNDTVMDWAIPLVKANMVKRLREYRLLDIKE